MIGGNIDFIRKQDIQATSETMRNHPVNIIFQTRWTSVKSLALSNPLDQSA